MWKEARYDGRCSPNSERGLETGVRAPCQSAICSHSRSSVAPGLWRALYRFRASQGKLNRAPSKGEAERKTDSEEAMEQD